MVSSRKILNILLFVLLFIMLGVTAFFHLTWAMDFQQLEQQRLETRLTKNIVRLTATIRQELFLLPTFATTSETDLSKIQEKALAAIQFWQAHASYTNIFTSIYLYTPWQKTQFRILRENSFVPHSSAETATIKRNLGSFLLKRNGELQPNFISSAENLTFLADCISRRDAQKKNYIVCLIDYTVLTEKMLPELIQTIFEADDSYRYRMLNQTTGKTLFTSDNVRNEDDFKSPDFLLPLLPINNPDYFFMPPPFSVEKLPYTSSEIFSFIRTKLQEYSLRPSFQPPPLTSDQDGLPVVRNVQQNELLVLEFAHKDGSLFKASINSTILNTLSSLMVLAILGIGMLILMINMQRAQNLATKQQEFISTITHELKTPLAVITSAGENLSDGIISSPEKVKRYGQMIEKEGNRLRSNIEYFLLYSNMHTATRLNRKKTDSIELVSSILAHGEHLFAEHGFTVEKHWGNDPIYINCDVTAFSSVIQNLISNVIKHAQSGHFLSVCISTAVYPLKIGGKKICGTTMKQKAVVMRFIDHGNGIPKKEQKTIFEPFFRGAAALDQQVEGSGIGLNLAKRIVTLHGGTLDIETSGQKGTTFTVTVPLEETGK